jgi:dTMP kinase
MPPELRDDEAEGGPQALVELQGLGLEPVRRDSGGAVALAGAGEPDLCVVIDAQQPPDAVAQAVRAAVAARLPHLAPGVSDAPCRCPSARR